MKLKIWKIEKIVHIHTTMNTRYPMGNLIWKTPPKGEDYALLSFLKFTIQIQERYTHCAVANDIS